MKANEIRNAFIEFFKSKEHYFVPSAPIVVKNDPTLMFTNAGMNQFKDIFLGNKPVIYKRVVNSQKCLRVSGKHNDLEEVGLDTYHHTMFEMLGNWSFSDYFKKEAIQWAWEFLTEVLKIDKNRLYVTVFEGSTEEGLEKDTEAYEIWKNFVDETHILMGSKKDNFWEMGDTGPCGPCSEIHYDLRTDEERSKIAGHLLVNKGNPLVIEIWNLVFIQFNRLADGRLVQLSSKHVDTGMGFERLCMILQGKTSTYDTDIFQPLIRKIEELSSKKYGTDEFTDVAMRVLADHIRAVSFSIADGQLPSNTGAGYVIRRILRRAVRYAYSRLNFTEPVLYQLVDVLVNQMGNYFNELKHQQQLIEKVIYEEEQNFLRTLDVGIKRFENYINKEIKNSNSNVIDGKFVFELYDTYGFPIDLIQLMARENGLTVDIEKFNLLLNEQRERSRKDAQVNASDWIYVTDEKESIFVGYDTTKINSKIIKYRAIEHKNKTLYHLVLEHTPFYAESGGQVGDTGILKNDDETIEIIDTIKENDLIIHVTNKLPSKVEATFTAEVNEERRHLTERNHSATHLLHYALRNILGPHVEQKGSLVHPDYLRFDFSHPAKLTDKEIEKIELFVNDLIWQAIELEENRNMKLQEAQKMGVIALFGEKYGEIVRMIKFGNSMELCGGTHVKNTAYIGLFKIVSETAIAAGIRRIEAVTYKKAYEYLQNVNNQLKQIKLLFNNPKDIIATINSQFEQLKQLQKKLDELKKEKVSNLKNALLNKQFSWKNYSIIAEKVEIEDTDSLRDLVFQLKNIKDNSIVLLATEIDNKAHVALGISDSLVKNASLNASAIIKELAKEIKGGGGGQPFFATAGGQNVNGIPTLLKKIQQILSQ
jgi:alanyl-tRNA synthetase